MILVTGAGGMVGTYVHELRATFPELLELTDVDSLDVRDWEAVRSRVARASLVIHLAAETDVDRCETDRDHAYQTNAIGTHNVALACQMVGVPLVYISTAGVFGGDGAAGPFSEQDEPHPANYYGATKLAGERIVERLLQRAYVFRPGWMMGGRSKDKKFVSKIVHQVLGGRREIKAVTDKVGSPTYARDLVEQIRHVISTGRYGLYHATNTGVCSRYEVASRIVSRLDPSVRVTPVGSDEFPLPAARAGSEAMRNLHLELMGLDRMRSWQDALDAYLDDWMSELRPASTSSK